MKNNGLCSACEAQLETMSQLRMGTCPQCPPEPTGDIKPGTLADAFTRGESKPERTRGRLALGNHAERKTGIYIASHTTAYASVGGENRDANAAHLVACWNAVESIGGDPETVGRLVAAVSAEARDIADIVRLYPELPLTVRRALCASVILLGNAVGVPVSPSLLSEIERPAEQDANKPGSLSAGAIGTASPEAG